MKKTITATLLLILAQTTCISAQTSPGNFERFRQEKTEEFMKWRQEKQTEFEKYRQRLNEEFADMMERSWKNYGSTAPEKRRERSEPVKPLDADNVKISQPREIPVDVVTPPERAIPDIPVTLPKVTPGRQVTYPVTFTFYHTTCGINTFDTSALSFNDLSSKSLSTAWRRLSNSGATSQLLDDCLRLREELNLCDWGFMKLIETMAAKLYPRSTDKQAFLTVFLLTQAGYDTKFAMRGNKLCPMFHPSHKIYSRPFYNLGNKDYYISGPLADTTGSLSICDLDFHSGATPIRMVMNRIPSFTSRPEAKRVYSSALWKKAPPVEVEVNPSVIEFMNDYPLLDWQLYGLSQLSAPIKSRIYQALAVIIDGMDEVEAVNTLLDYMQFGFNYMTDGEQFGYEKPFFFDENFYYPANDCEDRAILFAKLVKSLLGLDVVYLNYPRHLAAAVKFSSDIKGTYVIVDGEKYFVCDPTCLHGKAGVLAAVYANSRPKVVKIAE